MRAFSFASVILYQLCETAHGRRGCGQLVVSSLSQLKHGPQRNFRDSKANSESHAHAFMQKHEHQALTAFQTNCAACRR